MSLKKRESPNNRLVSGYFIVDSVRKSSKSNVLGGGPCLKNIHSLSSVCSATESANDVSFDGSSRDEQIASSSFAPHQISLGERTLKLLSGSCYLPHPAKEKTGGEDAHFICADEQAIGVADGVGGWADVGVMLENSPVNSCLILLQQFKRSPRVPLTLPGYWRRLTHAQRPRVHQQPALLRSQASGFMLVRDGCTIFQSPVQQHGFNFTYQLESGYTGDLPSSGQVFTIPAILGDVIVAGTDGLFDNLYDNEVTAVVVHTLRAGLGPQVTAQKIAALARQWATDRNRQTPFSTTAQDAGFRYYGGKLDDITVVVSYITCSSSV